MIQCDMHLNKNIYFYVNKTKRALLAWRLHLVECGVNLVVSRLWVACVESGVDVTIASLSNAGNNNNYNNNFILCTKIQKLDSLPRK